MTHGQYLTIDTAAGAFRAYLARPQTIPAPTIVVVEENFGVNADLRDTRA